jgi:hypothetical protein
MSGYALSKDGLSWRTVESKADCAEGEVFSETIPELPGVELPTIVSGYAVRKDGNGFRAVGHSEECSADETFSEAVPTLPNVESDTLIALLAKEYEKRMSAIASAYPQSERESWPVQTEEAKALLADSKAVTPWIDAAATARGVARAELASRILTKTAAYRAISGKLTGARQKIEDAITAAGPDLQKLQAINVTAGWPD